MAESLPAPPSIVLNAEDLYKPENVLTTASLIVKVLVAEDVRKHINKLENQIAASNLEIGKLYHKTMVNVSVMVYFTPDFKSLVPKPNNYIQSLINLANTAYNNSGIPLRIHSHCSEELYFSENKHTQQYRKA
jgi:hypothetical protein